MDTASVTQQRPSGRRTSTFSARRHEEAIVQAEARRLSRALAPYRVLRKQTLERVSGASRWHDGTFERALGSAIRSGLIDRLPAGFYRYGRSGGGRARNPEAREAGDAS